jgi:hypothetical protein
VRPPLDPMRTLARVCVRVLGRLATPRTRRGRGDDARVAVRGDNGGGIHASGEQGLCLGCGMHARGLGGIRGSLGWSRAHARRQGGGAAMVVWRGSGGCPFSATRQAKAWPRAKNVHASSSIVGRPRRSSAAIGTVVNGSRGGTKARLRCGSARAHPRQARASPWWPGRGCAHVRGHRVYPSRGVAAR